MASGARGAPEITPAEKEAIDGIRDFLAVEFEGAQNVPDSRILEALKNYGMDRTRAHEELCVELSRSSWDTVPTKEKKRTDNKREGNQDDSSAPSGRGRGRGSGPGRGGGRGESWGDQGSRGPGGRGGRWETAGDRPRGGGAGPGGDRGRGSRGRGGPGPGPPRPVQPRPGNFEGGVAPGPQVPRASSGPPPAEVHKPPPQPPAAAPAPVLDAPIPQNQWSKGRPRTEEPPKPAEPPVPPSAAMPQWASMPQSAQELQSAGSDLGGQLSSVPAGGMQGMMGATSAQANATAVSSSVGTNGGASAAAARGADVMQQFRAQPSPDALASNFSSLGFGDGGAGMPRSPQKPAADSMAQAQAAVQPQDMSAFSDPAQSSSLFPQYGQVSGGASAVPAQSQHQFQQQAAAPSQAAPQASQAAQVPAQAQDNVYDSSGKDEAQTYGMAGMGADTSASQAAQQQAYNRMGYAGTAAQAAAGTATKQPAAGQAGYGQPAAGVEGGMGQAGMQPQQMAQQQQQQQLSWQQQQQAQQQQQSMMHWANTSAYGWGDPRMFQQMYMMGYGTQVPMQMYNQNYQQTQPNPMAGGGHAGKQGFNAQSGKKNQQQSQQNQQYGSTPGYGSGYGGGSGFPGYGDMSSGGSQDYYKSQAAAAGGYGGMYPMFNGMPMEGMGGYGMGGQTAGQAATSSTMRGYAPMGGASAGATGMQGMDPSMSNAGGSYLGQGGGLDDQKSSWGAGGQ